MLGNPAVRSSCLQISITAVAQPGFSDLCEHSVAPTGLRDFEDLTSLRQHSRYQSSREKSCRFIFHGKAIQLSLLSAQRGYQVCFLNSNPNCMLYFEALCKAYYKDAISVTLCSQCFLNATIQFTLNATCKGIKMNIILYIIQDL